MKTIFIFLLAVSLYSCKKEKNTCTVCHTDVWQKDGSITYVKYSFDTSICTGDRESIEKDYIERYSGVGPHGNYALNKTFVTTCK